MLLLSVLCSPNPNEPLMYSYGRMDMLRMRGGVRIRLINTSGTDVNTHVLPAWGCACYVHATVCVCV